METIFGLPTHVLAVHAPIVLIPLGTIAALVLAVRPDWRRKVGWLSVGYVGVVFVSTVIAVESGNAFNDAFDGAVDVSRHQQLGETTRFIVLLWLVATIGVVAYEYWAARQRTASDATTVDAGEASPTALAYGLGALTLVLSVLATVWVIRTGHSGADAVWKQTTDFIFE